MILTFKTSDIVQILERNGVELHEAEISTLDHMILDLNMLIEEETKSRENPDIEELVLNLYRRHVASLYGKVEEVTAHHKPNHKVPPPFKVPGNSDYPMGACTLSDCR